MPKPKTPEQIKTSEVLVELFNERQRQDKKWGQQNHPCLNQDLLNSKGGCVPLQMTMYYEIPSEKRAKLMCDSTFKNNKGTYAHIALEELSEAISAFDVIKRREELVQLAAVTVAWIEKIDRDLNQ